MKIQTQPQADSERETLLAFIRSESVPGLSLERWQAVALLAQKQGLQPLLFWRLQSLGLLGEVPVQVLNALREQYLTTAHRNARIYAALADLLAGFEAEQVPCIPLKGVYLAERVYGNVAVRPMADIDLLIKASDLSAAERAMQALGYVGPRESDQTMGEREHNSYTHGQTALLVDVHWDLIHTAHYGIAVDIERLWEQSAATLLANKPAREMSVEDQVLYLCVHAAKDYVTRPQLSSICDLAETLKRNADAVDWKGLVARAQLWHAERCAYANLRLAQLMFKALIPNATLQALAPADGDMRHAVYAEEQVYGRIELRRETWLRSRDVAKLAANRSLGQRLYLIWRRIFPARRQLARYYALPPESLKVWLYYPVWLWDLARQFGGLFWQLLRGDDETRVWLTQNRHSDDLQAWLFPSRFAPDANPVPMANRESAPGSR